MMIMRPRSLIVLLVAVFCLGVPAAPAIAMDADALSNSGTVLKPAKKTKKKAAKKDCLVLLRKLARLEEELDELEEEIDGLERKLGKAEAAGKYDVIESTNRRIELAKEEYKQTTRESNELKRQLRSEGCKF